MKKNLFFASQPRSCNAYSANWCDCHHLGFLNLFLYALIPHSRSERNELVLSRPLSAHQLNPLWPRPWLYLRSLMFFLLEFALLYACWRLEGRDDSSVLLPGLAMMGALTMPITLLIFFWEVNKWRSLTLLDVLRYFFIGSCIVIALAFALRCFIDLAPSERFYYNARGNYFTPSVMLNYGDIPLVLTALIEELPKAIAIMGIAYVARKHCTILQCILIGAAVGAGFAVIESAGYAFKNVDNILETIVIRSLTAPACHVAWGALLGGSLAMSAKGNLRLRTFFKPTFLLALVSVCLLHFVWNYLFKMSAPLNRVIELSVFTWFLLLLMIREGVKETARATH